jgi:hypothetical protein
LRKDKQVTPIERLLVHLPGASVGHAQHVAVWAGKPPKPFKRFYVYQETSDGRLWLTKVATGGDALLTNEARALVWLADRLRATDLAATVPRAVKSHDNMLVVEWVSARSLVEGILRARRWAPARGYLAARCAAVVGWLARFHQLTGRGAGVGAIHGDFRPTNILIGAQDELIVVDWELFSPEALQVFDLLHFATHVGLGCIGGDIAHGMQWGLLKPTWVSELVNALIKQYFLQMGRRPDDLVAVYHEFLRFLRDRRRGLGLANEDHFITELQRLMQQATAPPYALGV